MISADTAVVLPGRCQKCLHDGRCRTCLVPFSDVEGGGKRHFCLEGIESIPKHKHARAEEPMELNVSLFREEGWVRPTRSKPQPKFTWWGAQLTWDGAVQGWWEDYSLVGSLFVALQSEHLFTVA